MTFRERREKFRSKRRQKEKESTYSWSDLFGDVLFYFPELLFLPFRLVWWGFRVIARLIRVDFW